MKRDNKDMKVLLESWRGYVSPAAEVLTEGEKRGEKMEEMRGEKMEEEMHDDAGEAGADADAMTEAEHGDMMEEEAGEEGE